MADINEELVGLLGDIYTNSFDRVLYWIYRADKLLSSVNGRRVTRYYTAEDVVSDIMVRLMTGKIIWDKEIHPDFNMFMNERIYNRVKTIRRKANRTDLFEDYCENDNESEDGEDDDLTPLNLVHDILDDLIEATDFKERFRKCENALEKNEEYIRIFREMRDDNTNEEIAEKFGISLNDLLNKKKQICRIIRKL